MKVAVSYLKSNLSFEETINKINSSKAGYIHADIMDGKYVANNTFDKKKIKYLSVNSKKYIDVHLMTINPSKYLKYFKKEIFSIIYFHPVTDSNPIKFIEKVKKLNKKVGIVINPTDKYETYKNLLALVDYVLVMSVTPGAGGQKFIMDTLLTIDSLQVLKSQNNYNYKLSVDGGINSETVKHLINKNIDYVVSGSYVCLSEDYDLQIDTLK